MSYLSAKKIYPGNFTEALNGWYKNIDTTDSGSNDKSVGGPTSVLAVPGYRYFQQRGYAQITGKVGAKVSSADVIVPSGFIYPEINKYFGSHFILSQSLRE